MKSRPFVFIGLNILLIVSCLGCGKETGSWRELDNRSLPVSFSGYTKHPNQRVKVLVQDELGNWETIAETTTASVASHHLDVCVSNGRFASQMSPDARRFVSSEFGRSIEIHDSITGGTERSLPAHNGHTYCFAFGSTGRYMVTGGSDNRVRVWDLAITDRRLVMSRSPGARIKALVISPTNIEMAVALSQNSSKKHRIEIRDVASHKIIRELIGHTNWPTCFAYSPEGTKLLSGGLDNTIRVWNPKSTASENTARQLNVQRNRFSCLAVPHRPPIG